MSVQSVVVANYSDLYVKYQSGSINHPVSQQAPVISSNFIVKDPSVVLGELLAENTQYSDGDVSITIGNATATFSYQGIIEGGYAESFAQYWSVVGDVLVEGFSWDWTGAGDWYVDLDMSPNSASSPSEINFVQQFVFMAKDFYPVEYGVQAVNEFSYSNILNMVTFSSSDVSLPVKIYSNGGDSLVMNEHIGKLIPSNIEFIPAYSWDGSEKKYEESELDVSGV